MDTFLRTTTDADRVTTVTMDVPGKPVNTCTPGLLAELRELVDKLAATPADQRPAGLIITSAKERSFNAGADLVQVRGMSEAELSHYLSEGQAVFDKLAHLPIPTVAAINGDCMGGGFELALACAHRVAADDGSISIGLPETKLGLIPAWGGATRLPRLIGLTRALPILLAGKTMPPKKAQRAGLIDEVVRPEALLLAAKRLIKDTTRHTPKFFDRTVGTFGPLRRKVLRAAREQTLAKTFGNYPAQEKLLDVVAAGYERGFDAGLAAERAGIAELVKGDACRNLLRVFFLRGASKKWATEKLSAKPAKIEYAAVVGGGTMGAGIVHALAKSGINVRLIEVSPEAVSAGLTRVRAMLDGDVAEGKLDKLAARKVMNRVVPCTDWTGLKLADLVVEAVVENLPAKHAVFARLDPLTRPDCVLATNTSSLRVADIGSVVRDPSRVVGLHFFNPVNKMPLVEVVRTPTSGDPALATAAALALRLGKIAVIVADAPGFLVNRILIPYLAEALTMAEEGTSIEAIDTAMKMWGMPMGPFELLDEIGLDVAASVLKSLKSPDDQTTLSPAIAQALTNKWLGKKTGRGFYVHEKPKKKGKPGVTRLNDELAKLIHPATGNGHSRPAPTEEEIQWRLVLPMVNPAAGALRERVTDSADAIDLATVMGTGLAPFRGGLARFVDTIGVPEIVRRMTELQSKHGDRFAPDPLLRELAAAGGTLGGYVTLDRASAGGAPTSSASSPASAVHG
ncbi:MAG: 3-hydroxyacyl-CoA dehydrogenase NAD-binding domain-containing protein [Phycisphaerae bacterium]